MQFETIPLAQLEIAPENVRKTKPSQLEQIAASIKAHGLQQNLVGYRSGDKVFISAGGRRLTAMRMLLKAGDLPEDLADGAPVKITDVAQAQEGSLAENAVREAMHPADEFAAFHALATAEPPLSTTEIANRFGVKEHYVLQRLKLAKVSPKILAEYRAGKTTLDVVEACTLSDDHAAQERAYKGNATHPYMVRRELTKSDVEANSKRAKFVGLEAYKAAGGKIRHDMFQGEEEGTLVDVKLLDKLVDEKLEARAAELRKKGWGWVEAGANLDAYDYPSAGAKVDKAKAGAIVTLDWQGNFRVVTGLLKKGQRATAGKVSGKPKAAKPARKPGELSFAVQQVLQAERNVVLRRHLADNPRIALAALAASLAGDYGIVSAQGADDLVRVRRDNTSAGRVPLSVRNVGEKSEAAIAIRDATKAWKDRVPKRTSVFAWLLTQPEAVTHELLALCTANALMAIDCYAPVKDPAREFADIAGIDMATRWAPSAEWLARLPTSTIAAAVEQAAGKEAAAALRREKGKPAIARKAAQLLTPAVAGERAPWVPEPFLPKGVKATKLSVPPAAPKKAAPAPKKPAAKKAAKKAKR